MVAQYRKQEKGLGSLSEEDNSAEKKKRGKERKWSATDNQAVL